MLATVAASLVVLLSTSAVAADTPRQIEVDHNSGRVMPFRLDATTHAFVPTPSGGVETITVHHADARQIALVRSHLRKEARAFARGDFSDPAAIHGAAMPGLRAIRAGAANIDVRYVQVQKGAAIRYATKDPALVSAIHAWFKAQVSDHGRHATMTM